MMKLEKKPKFWEDRFTLYGAFLFDSGVQSATLKSYKSAIKNILVTDNYKWDDSKVLINCLTGACKMHNDRVKMRLPIHVGLLELLLFELECKFQQQIYLESLYKTVLALGYYRLFRIGELTKGPHTIKAKMSLLETIKTRSWSCYIL